MSTDVETSGVTVDADGFNAFGAAGWEQRPDGYHHLAAGLTTRMIERLLDAAAVGRGKRVVDVGTGPGYVAAACAVRGADVVGIDVAAEMVALARKLGPEIEFRQGTPSGCPLPTARSTQSSPTS